LRDVPSKRKIQASDPDMHITIVPAARRLTCPACNARLAWQRATIDTPFFCPECKQGVVFRPRYLRTLNVVSLSLAGLVAYGLGIRDDALLAAVLLMLLPAHWVILFISIRVFPPDLEPTGDYRGILFGLTDSDDSEHSPLEPDAGSPTTSPPTAVDQGNRGTLFKVTAEPHSVEGLVLGVAAMILVGSAGWMLVEPLVYRLAPGVNATRTGPAGFPVTILIGETALSVTNGSNDLWSCRVELGAWAEHGAGLGVAPRQTSDVPYARFEPGASDAELSRLARQSIAITCADESNTAHMASF
jgi:hypothetical protein